MRSQAGRRSYGKQDRDRLRSQSRAYYVDGHRKAVHSAQLIPRGLVSRYGKVLGCRALMLLHDEQGHPLLATIHRGDTHLTTAFPNS